jgi:hypothetical protein
MRTILQSINRAGKTGGGNKTRITTGIPEEMENDMIGTNFVKHKKLLYVPF